MIDIKLTNLKEVIDHLAGFELPEVDMRKLVNGAGKPIAERLKENYRNKDYYNEKRKSGNHLIDTIKVYPQKKNKSGSKRTYFASYIGPKFGKGGGQQAVFLEWGTAYRNRSNPKMGGVSYGKGRTYGATLPTGRMFKEGLPKIGQIRKTKDEMEETTIQTLKNGVIKIADKEWNKK